jgi:hypothetical protein
MAFNMAGGGGG